MIQFASLYLSILLDIVIMQDIVLSIILSTPKLYLLSSNEFIWDHLWTDSIQNSKWYIWSHTLYDIHHAFQKSSTIKLWVTFVFTLLKCKAHIYRTLDNIDIQIFELVKYLFNAMRPWNVKHYGVLRILISKIALATPIIFIPLAL